MKISLAYIPPEEERYNRSYPSFPPLGIGYIAAYLKKRKQSSSLYDVTYETDSWLIEKILEEEIDIAGFSAYPWNTETIIKITDKLKEEKPSIKIILGGPDASYNPEKYIKHNSIDGVYRGEGEKAFANMAEGKPVNLYTKKSKTNIQIIENLEEIPSPYLEKIFNLEKYHIIPFQTHRGCVYKCKFCRWQYPGPVRYYPLKQAALELEYLSQIRNLYVLQCIDADFLYDKQYANQLLNHLIEKHVKFPQANFEVYYENFDTETGSLMNKIADSVIIAYGLETSSPTILKSVGKRIDLKKFKRKIRETKNTGIKVQVNLLVGLPEQNWETVERTIEYTKDLDPDRIVVNTVHRVNQPANRKKTTDYSSLPDIELKKIQEKVIKYLKKGF
ncbi:MAG: cobalamin-dependent protein [Candidatus Odinarchaeum yellowstonii]|uniref:Cobalamin-dependent protein n=1 Tax=Odinarchaeota yellowstonii (strain LCB_4) TaxID=1841599 RepID=A0AAF0D3L9_ODILC|nr:MAG: cobalamin-dependent protein [Candidatus Odinarchaeum yellowstonii]